MPLECSFWTDGADWPRIECLQTFQTCSAATSCSSATTRASSQRVSLVSEREYIRNPPQDQPHTNTCKAESKFFSRGIWVQILGKLSFGRAESCRSANESFLARVNWKAKYSNGANSDFARFNYDPGCARRSMRSC